MDQTVPPSRHRGRLRGLLAVVALVLPLAGVWVVVVREPSVPVAAAVILGAIGLGIGCATGEVALVRALRGRAAGVSLVRLAVLVSLGVVVAAGWALLGVTA